jgi:hypothetical protein
MERPFVQENARERARIKKLADSLSDTDLNLPLSAGWNIAVALVHLAFWDQRAVIVTQKWKKEGVKALPAIDTDNINDALVPISLAIPPRLAANLALAAADAIDTELEQASDVLIEAISALNEPTRLNRAKHRKLHIDEILTVLKARGKKLEF